MKNILYIFIGGGLGSVLRFLISNYTQKLVNIHTFPLGTFVVNYRMFFNWNSDFLFY